MTNQSAYTRQTITRVHFWVPGKLLSLHTTRDPAYQFTAGQFARLGLPAADDPQGPPTLWRAYSMVNGPHQEGLEFYSIVVPDGEFSPLLATLQPGDALYVDKTPVGFLTLDRFAPGGNLWLLATGTGLSAYLSMLQDSNIWENFERIIVVHGVRQCEEFAYGEALQAWSRQGPPASVHPAPVARLSYLPIPTREALPGMPQARLTQLIEDGRLEQLADCPLDPAHSKIMLCGNPEMVTQARGLLQARGFAAGRRGNTGTLAVENYW